MKTSLRALALAAALAMPAFAGAAENPMVGGAPMFADKNIIENAVNSADHTTLVAAVQAAGLVETLSGPGPFTVFAPVNAAFDALPAGTVETLLKPENKDQLVKILACHVIGAAAPGTDSMATDSMSSDSMGGDAMMGGLSAMDAMSMIADNGGAYEVTTLGGCKLWLKTEGDKLTVTDENGTVANVTIADVVQSNGVIHVIDKVLLPKM